MSAATAPARSSQDSRASPTQPIFASDDWCSKSDVFKGEEYRRYLRRLEQMEKGDHSANFPLEWALKDLDLVAAAAGTQAVPVAGAIADRWRGLVVQGYGRLDVSAARLGLDSGTKQNVPA